MYQKGTGIKKGKISPTGDWLISLEKDKREESAYSKYIYMFNSRCPPTPSPFLCLHNTELYHKISYVAGGPIVPLHKR